MDAPARPPPDTEDAHTIGRTSARRPRVELITRGERRRTWTIEQKREIVAESLGAETTPTEVVRKHAISSGLLYTWRQQLLGRQVATLARSRPSFAQVEAAGGPRQIEMADRLPMERATPDATAPVRPDGLIEIVLVNGVMLRVDAQVDGRALRRVLGALDVR
jgi:transposase